MESQPMDCQWIKLANYLFILSRADVAGLDHLLLVRGEVLSANIHIIGVIQIYSLFGSYL